MKYIAIHHSGVSRKNNSNQFWSINAYHKEKFNMKSRLGLYGGYNFLIEPNGDIKQYREVGEETAAQKGHNHDAISICLTGDFNIEMPTDEQINTLRGKILSLKNSFAIPLSHILPHRELQENRTCYGNLLADDWAQKLIERPLEPLEDMKKKELLKYQLSLLQKLLELLKQLKGR